MPLKKRPLSRKDGMDKDASLVVIASEDTYAVKQYFERFFTTRVAFLVLSAEDRRSDPKSVVERINDFHRDNATQDGDEFWVCIDRDRWPAATMNKILGECHQKGYKVAINVPCFELWLLLHHEDPDSALLSHCDSICERLKDLLGGYNKTNCCRTMQLTAEMVDDAIRRAKRLDTSESLPTTPVTRVHNILASLVARQTIVLRSS